MDELKFCRGCSQDLPKAEFAKRADRPLGTSSRCKKCLSADLRKKYQDPEFAEKDIARASKWAKDNPEKHVARTTNWKKQNPEKVSKQQKRWYDDNKERVRDNQRTYEKERYNTDPNYMLRKRLRSRMYDIFRSETRNGKKAGSHVRDLGCSITQLISYMEDKFTPEMTWDNHGALWEIDHVVPLANFDLTDRKQFLEACHFTNLQPLGIDEHLEKTTRELADTCNLSTGQ